MKKRRILCALANYQAISDLSRLEKECDITHVVNSEHAIQALTNNDFDAVLTDFKPDPTFEIPLLERVNNRFPNVLRFMLIDVASKASVTDTNASQYLVKPCHATSVVSALERTQLIQTWFRNPTLRQLLPQMKKLPSIPAIYLRVSKELQSEMVDLNAVGAIISEDFNLTARVLQMVNSAAFGLGRTVSNPQEAIQFLGIEKVKGLVLMAGLSQAKVDPSVPLSVDKLWQHSIQTARLAREITKLAGKARLAEEAFTAGLLHDVGKLLFAVNISERYTPILKESTAEGRSLHRTECDTLGVTHELVGACILATWGLPGSIVGGIAFHHRPADLGTEFTIATAVHIANAFAHGWTRKMPNIEIDLPYLRDLKMDNQLDAWQEQLVRTVS